MTIEHSAWGAVAEDAVDADDAPEEPQGPLEERTPHFLIRSRPLPANGHCRVDVFTPDGRWIAAGTWIP